MADCQPNIEIHKAAGSTQSNRFLEALKDDFVKVDERNILDLIEAANALSDKINFYSSDNIVMGVWRSFFKWESTSILAQITTFNISKYVTNFKLQKRKLLFIISNDDRKEIIELFFYDLNSIIKGLNAKVNHLPDSFEIKEYFKSTYPTIESLLNDIITQIEASTDVAFLLQHHLFNKKLHNIFGLLSDWKSRSYKQLHINLEVFAGHSPHYALYLTFLKLFEYAQYDLNTYTKRHLDFYYKDILHLLPENGISDYVHCIIEPHNGEGPFTIEKDSAFIAGKDSEGNAKYYTATSDSTINQAKIKAIYAGYNNDLEYYFEDLTDKNATGESWQPFKENSSDVHRGIVLASPLFFLRGGTRIIRLIFKNGDNGIEINPTDYIYYLSEEKEWLEIKEEFIFKNDTIIEFTISPEEGAIVPFNSEIHEGVTIDTPFPVLKIISKDKSVANFSFGTVEVEIDVTNYKQFNLYSDTGTIDHTKSFQPFGAIPKSGRSLIFSCNEFFQKLGAIGQFKIITDNDSQITAITKLSHLKDGHWINEDDWKGETIDYNIKNNSLIDYDFSENSPLTTEATSGFLKIILSHTKYDGQTFLENFIEQAKNPAPVELTYVPTINEISFNYNVPFTSEQIDVYQLYPKGYKKLNSSFNILPVPQYQGELFIGIKDVEPGNAVSLLFQVAEGTANPRQLSIELIWSYLYDDEWINFESDEIGDESNGLTQSGIVQLQVPENINLQEQSIFPKGIWWIKIGAPDPVDAICHLVGIHTQALKAGLSDFEQTGVSFEENIGASTISKLYRPKNQIKKIEQPYASFGGVVKESDVIFYQRTSERLRHKDKAITNWDYEKLVLDNFPEVFRVKCLNHYRYDENEVNNSSSGYVTIIPVAQSIEQNVPDYWKPIVDIGTMKRIKSFLQSKTSPHVRINVKPPKLEKLDVNFSVKYKEIPGADSRLFTEQLKAVINTYLSPWAYKSGTALSFQTEIEKSELIQLIEKQEYVDYISEFKVNHIVLMETSDDIKQQFNDIETIIPKTPYSLFVPNNHSITAITIPCCV